MDKKVNKIIAISASPSKGRNSDTMLDYFIKGMESNSKNNLLIERFCLEDIHFDHYNYYNGKGPTENEKDFAKLAEKFKEADGIIMSTPVYNFSVPARLKNFIDRIRFIAVDLENKNIIGQPTGKFKNHRMYFLVSGGTPKWAKDMLFFLYPGFWLRVVFAYYGSFKTKSFYSGDIKTFENKKILDQCFKKGLRFSKKFK